jgi:hypothetical protein
LSAAVD